MSTASCSTTGVDMATKCGDNVMAAHDGVVLSGRTTTTPLHGLAGTDLTLYKNHLRGGRL